jgi:hypothetical protein
VGSLAIAGARAGGSWPGRTKKGWGRGHAWEIASDQGLERRQKQMGQKRSAKVAPPPRAARAGARSRTGRLGGYFYPSRKDESPDVEDGLEDPQSCAWWSEELLGCERIQEQMSVQALFHTGLLRSPRC